MKSTLNQLLMNQYSSDIEEGEGHFFLLNHGGLTVKQMGDFRSMLYEKGARFRVVKRRVLNHVLKGKGIELSEASEGSVGVVYAFEDFVGVAKSLGDFFKVEEKIAFFGGYVDGTVVESSEFKELASLPSREVLLGRLMGSMVSPVRGMLAVLTAAPRDLVGVIKALEDKKS